MKCVNENKLSAFLDGELGNAERALIQRHLDECPRCRKRADEYKMVWGMLDSMESLEPEPFLATRVSEAALAEQKKERWEHVLIPLITSAAAVISLCVGSFLGRALYAEFSGSSTNVASATDGQIVASSYGAYPAAQGVEFYSNQEGGY